jgi:ribose transport system permease protein
MKRLLVGFVTRFTIVPILLVLIVLFAVIERDFFTFGNLRNILLQSSINGVMAIGMTFLMINGLFDLSVGTLMGLSATLAIGLQPFGLAVAILASLAAGVVVGLINGLLTTKAHINAFIVTLATMIGVRGLTYVYCKEQSFSGQIQGFNNFAESRLFGIPTFAWIFVVLVLVCEFVLARTRHGRNTYAVGGNSEAAFNAGIDTSRTTIINFVICSVAAALGGIMIAARMNASVPTLGWPDANLVVISCVVLGGTSLSGGYGGMLYTLGGTLTISMIKNALNLLNVQTYYNSIITGLVLILIVYFDRVLRKRSRVSIETSASR